METIFLCIYVYVYIHSIYVQTSVYSIYIYTGESFSLNISLLSTLHIFLPLSLYLMTSWNFHKFTYKILHNFSKRYISMVIFFDGRKFGRYRKSTHK